MLIFVHGSHAMGGLSIYELEYLFFISLSIVVVMDIDLKWRFYRSFDAI